MTELNVLVVFYSRFGDTERLALAAGVGAIQQRASIRLRRVADLADVATIAANPAWSQNLDRMTRDYIAPRDADPAWADVIILATPGNSPLEMLEFVRRLRSVEGLSGKIAAPLATGDNEEALRSLYAEAACVGLIVVPASLGAEDAITRARACGSRVSALARALKAG